MKRQSIRECRADSRSAFVFGISDQSRNRVGFIIERVVASARALEETTIARRAGKICHNEQMGHADDHNVHGDIAVSAATNRDP